AELTNGEFKSPRAVGVQFRYAFVADAEGFKVVNISDPNKPQLVSDATIPLKNAGRFYLARNFAYVPNGPEGLAIIDITNPEKPRLHEMYNAKGLLTDVRAVQIGAVNASMYALVADGENGLRVLQMISPENNQQFMGFQPAPKPRLIATFPTKKPAVAVSRGLDRDRVVDETGNQTVVFGRRGSRPFNLSEMAKFLRNQSQPGSGVHDGPLYMVEDAKGPGRRLQLESGELAPPLEFKPEPEQPSIRPQTSRLVRRGRYEP
ncbi:MAG: LVIVD repeat-containing protein, partial [Limisphaerales bacterium]